MGWNGADNDFDLGPRQVFFFKTEYSEDPNTRNVLNPLAKSAFARTYGHEGADVGFRGPSGNPVLDKSIAGFDRCGSRTASFKIEHSAR
jgi:hypothetical protein